MREVVAVDEPAGWRALLRESWDAFWDLLLEARCVLCRAPASLHEPWLCEVHRAEVEVLEGPRCRLCALPTPHLAGVCGPCDRDPPPWRELVCALAYRGSGRELLLAAKLGRRSMWMRPLAEHLGAELLERSWARGTPIVPVPLHARKRRERGFNQAERAAAWISERSGGRVADVLVRVRRTRPQGDPETLSRRANVRGAFELRRRRVPRRAILLDDVTTSGATLRECARKLRAAGCEELYAAAIFRAAALRAGS